MISCIFYFLYLIMAFAHGWNSNVSEEMHLLATFLLYFLEFLLLFTAQLLMCTFLKKKWKKKILPISAGVEFVLASILSVTILLYDPSFLTGKVIFKFAGMIICPAMIFLASVLLANVVYRLVNYVRQKNQNTVLQVE